LSAGFAIIPQPGLDRAKNAGSAQTAFKNGSNLAQNSQSLEKHGLTGSCGDGGSAASAQHFDRKSKKRLELAANPGF